MLVAAEVLHGGQAFLKDVILSFYSSGLLSRRLPPINRRWHKETAALKIKAAVVFISGHEK